MAGRGCTIKLHVLRDGGTVEDISLPVALHSPLEVLKQQLAQITGIEFPSQVLILCDLTDPERNRDILLSGRDHVSLRDCGLRNNSYLTLHRLGMPHDVQRELTDKTLKNKLNNAKAENVVTLSTPITAAQANHSYNGVIFDVSAKGPFEVTVTSISVAGMLGLVRVFARDRPWEADRTANPSSHWWAHRESVSRVGWEQIAEQACSPSWDKPYEIKFDTPVVLLPYQTRAFYVHSGLPDDLGIQYQSYDRDAVVAEDDHMTITPGVGHTGHTPFDEQQGWYRSYRALAGTITYSVRRKGWQPNDHNIFPAQLRESVRQILLCHQRGNLCPDTRKQVFQKGFPSLPKHVVYYIMEFMHWDWFKDMAADTRPSDRRLGSASIRSRASAESRGALEGTQRATEATGASIADAVQRFLESHGLVLEGGLASFSNQLGARMGYNLGMDDDDEEEDDDDDDNGDDNEEEEEETDDRLVGNRGGRVASRYFESLEGFAGNCKEEHNNDCDDDICDDMNEDVCDGAEDGAGGDENYNDDEDWESVEESDGGVGDGMQVVDVEDSSFQEQGGASSDDSDDD